MPTRLYTAPTTSAYLTPSSASAGWRAFSGGFNAMGKAPASVGSSSMLVAGDGTANLASRCVGFVSPPLREQMISGTIKGQFLCAEGLATNDDTLAFSVRVIKADGTVRGELLPVTYSTNVSATPPELAVTTNTNRKLRDGSDNTSINLNSVYAFDGDVLVFEIGIYRQSTNLGSSTIVPSYRASYNDLAENDTSTSTTENSWIEFSDDILFRTPEVVDLVVSTPTDSASATNTTNPTVVTPPANCKSGDLVLMIAQVRTAAATLTISQAGGQTWTSEAAISTTNQTARLFWCTFNGTWSANPSVSMGGTTCNTVVMHVFRPPSSSSTWSVNVAQVELDIAAAATQTITGQTTTGTNPTITVAGWFTADDNTWGNVGGTGWAQLPSANTQYRNTSGSDQSCTFAWKKQTAAGATGNVSMQQLTLGNDAATSFIITFAASIPVDPNYYLIADTPASIVLAGQNANLAVPTILTADAGAINLAGQNAILNPKITADAGAISLAGQNAIEASVLLADSGSIALAGQNAILSNAVIMPALPASVGVAGQSEAAVIKMLAGTPQAPAILAIASDYTNYFRYLSMADPLTLYSPGSTPANQKRVAFSPDGNYCALASLTLASELVVFDSSWNPISVSGLPGVGIYGLAWSPDSSTLYASTDGSGGTSGCLSIPVSSWSASYLISASGTHKALAISPNGNYLVLGTYGSYAAFYTAPWPGGGTSLLFSAATANSCAFSPDGSLLAFALQTAPYLVVYNIPAMTTVTLGASIPGSASDLVFSPDGTRLYIGHTNSPYLTVLDTTAWTAIGGTPDDGQDIKAVAVSADGNYLAIGGAYLSIYETNTWASVGHWISGAYAPYGLSFKGGGAALVTNITLSGQAASFVQQATLIADAGSIGLAGQSALLNPGLIAQAGSILLSDV